MNGELFGLGRTYWIGIVLILSASGIIVAQGEIPQQWLDFVWKIFAALAAKSGLQKFSERKKE